MIKIIQDVDLFPHIKEYDVILIGTNIYGSLGNGIQREIALDYPYADRINRATRYGDPDKIGTIIDCSEENEPSICLMYYFNGPSIKHVKKGEDWINYEAFERCIKLANVRYKGKNVACPMLGCSKWDGLGDKDKILEILNKNVTNFNLTIYDYEQKSRDEKLVAILKAETELKEISGYAAYHDAVKKRKEEAEKRFQRNGHARY